MLIQANINIQSAIDRLKDFPQVECPVKHYFADGQYVRETFMAGGTFAIGKKHKTKVVNILLKGKISLFIDKDTTEIITAPCIWVSQAGVQKIAYFHEDTVWVNTHPTNETDLDKIEESVIDKEIKWLG